MTPTTMNRSKAAVLTAILCLATGGLPCLAQQTDPALTAAVIAQTAELNSIHSKRKKTQEKIIAAETAATLALDRVHSVEDKMLEYLSNAQGAMQNLYQIKRAGELVLTEIPQNCSLLAKSVAGNLKGTAIAAIVSDELADAATQMAALYPFMKQLVTSGTYDVTGADGGNEKHKVNLLSSARGTTSPTRWSQGSKPSTPTCSYWRGRYARCHGTTCGSPSTRKDGPA